jgi:hypothetical protein
MFELPDRSGLVAMYSTGGDFIESSIQDRTAWLETANMQQTIVNVGCVAHRSIIQQYGIIHWFSPFGMISLNDAIRANNTSELVPLDQEMAWDKARIGPDLSSICCGAFENYLTVSVPWCSTKNRHTWSMDLASFEGNARAWNGVWTGWQPVQWTTFVVNGRPRCFFASQDHDGVCRVWEAFLGERTDNGCAITCSAQFKADDLRSVDRKRFSRAKLRIQQLYGNVSVMAAVAGNRGWFDRVLTRELVASEGRVNMEATYGNAEGSVRLGSNRPQTRDLTTEIWSTPSDCNQCNVESPALNNIDTHFTLFVGWSGQMAIAGYELFGIHEPEGENFECSLPEEEPKTLMAGGCASAEQYPDTEAFPDFTATGSYEIRDIENVAELISVTTTATSQISQADADRKADCHAHRKAIAIMYDPDIRNASGGVTVVLATFELAVYAADGVTLISEDGTIDFGDVNIGAYEEVTLVLKNVGLATGSITGFVIAAPLSLTQAPVSYELEPGETQTIKITYTPTA